MRKINLMILKYFIPQSLRALLRSIYVISYQYGYFKTLKRCLSIGPQNEPLPWLSYAAIFYLKRLDFSNCRILEFGSGGSTLFWANKAKEVISIETDRRWHEKISKVLPENVKIMLFEKDEFEKCLLALQDIKPFDVIIIDGAWRPQCALHCTKLLANTGLAILDNPDWYPTAHANMQENDYFEVSFSGITPMQAYSTTTNIYLTRNFSIPFGKDSFFSLVPGSILDNHEVEPFYKK
jgi:hypothetical protein